MVGAASSFEVKLVLVFTVVLLQSETVRGTLIGVGSESELDCALGTSHEAINDEPSSFFKKCDKSDGPNVQLGVTDGLIDKSDLDAGACPSGGSKDAATSVDAESPDKKVWLPEILSESLRDFSVKSDVNRECNFHSQLYLENLKKSTMWAVQMKDSSVNYMYGVLVGNSHSLGHFDECVQSFDKLHGVKGQYCLVQGQFHPSKETYPIYYDEAEFIKKFDAYSIEYDQNESFWYKTKRTVDPSKRFRDTLFWALCIPASCSAQDLASSLNHSLDATLKEHGVLLDITVEEQFCSTSEEVPKSFGYFVLKYILLASLVLTIIFTFYDVFYCRDQITQELLIKPKESNFATIVVSFSFYNTLCDLKKPDTSDELNCIHGVKTYGVIAIILGHRLMFTYGGPLYNPEFLEERYRKIEDSLLLNGTLVVDTFFFLTGFLTAHSLIKFYAGTKRMNLFAIYLNRWCRLMPLYMFMVAFYAHMLPHLGAGPLWKAKIGTESLRCQENWWLNLFFLNNYINTDKICMFQSWYVACDFHYLLLAPPLVFAMVKKPKLGRILLFLTLFVSTVLPIIIIYRGNYDGILRTYSSLLADPAKNYYYRNIYIKSHLRAIPFVYGIFAVYIRDNYRDSISKLTRKQIQLIFAFITPLALVSIIGGFVFYIPGRPYNVLENALFFALHRVTWTMTMGTVVAIQSLSGFGPLNPILCAKSFIPISRLNYSIFLVHGTLQLFLSGSLRNPEYVTFPRIFWMVFGDLLGSILIALIAQILIVAPSGGILTVLLTPRKKKVELKEGATRSEDKAKGLKKTTEVLELSNSQIKEESSVDPQS